MFFGFVTNQSKLMNFFSLYQKCKQLSITGYTKFLLFSVPLKIYLDFSSCVVKNCTAIVHPKRYTTQINSYCIHVCTCIRHVLNNIPRLFKRVFSIRYEYIKLRVVLNNRVVLSLFFHLSALLHLGDFGSNAFAKATFAYHLFQSFCWLNFQREYNFRFCLYESKSLRCKPDRKKVRKL